MRMEILVQLEYLLRVVLAAVCGAAIGYERESRMKSAGVRTHLIVAIASALMMVVSKYGFYDVLVNDAIRLDPSRIAAGVVSAIGFLGAGVIFVREQNVSGITTAAGIWATVGVGIAVGAGMYLLGVAVSLLIILVQILLHRKSRLHPEAIRGEVIVRLDRETDLDSQLAHLFTDRQISIRSMTVKKLEGEVLEVKLYVKYPECYTSADILAFLREVPDILYVEI